jgi:hypothetical protein
MNATEAINKIADLLGMKFKSEKFFATKLVDGLTEITNNKETDFQVGDELFLVEDSILKPAPAGRHETREGLIVELGEDSVIKMIEKKEASQSRVGEAEVEIKIESEMASATLTDGTKIETDEAGDFQVGQKLYVITQEGEKVGAPEGEHTTESGIVLTVDAESFITGLKYPDEAGEGSLESDMKKMKSAMSEMFGLVSSLNNDLKNIKKDYEEFKKQPQTSPTGVPKSLGKEKLVDLKYEFLKTGFTKK